MKFFSFWWHAKITTPQWVITPSQGVIYAYLRESLPLLQHMRQTWYFLFPQWHQATSNLQIKRTNRQWSWYSPSLLHKLHNASNSRILLVISFPLLWKPYPRHLFFSGLYRRLSPPFEFTTLYLLKTLRSRPWTHGYYCFCSSNISFLFSIPFWTRGSSLFRHSILTHHRIVTGAVVHCATILLPTKQKISTSVQKVSCFKCLHQDILIGDYRTQF